MQTKVANWLDPSPSHTFEGVPAVIGDVEVVALNLHTAKDEGRGSEVAGCTRWLPPAVVWFSAYCHSHLAFPPFGAKHFQTLVICLDLLSWDLSLEVIFSQIGILKGCNFGE